MTDITFSTATTVITFTPGILVGWDEILQKPNFGTAAQEDVEAFAQATHLHTEIGAEGEAKLAVAGGVVTLGGGNIPAAQIGATDETVQAWINRNGAFASREALIAALAWPWTVGAVVTAGSVAYRYDAVSTSIPDMQGWAPHGSWRFAHFGIVGAGDETTKLQSFFNAPVGTTIVGAELTVTYSSVTVPARNLSFISAGAVFNRSENSASSGFIIDGEFTVDELKMTYPGATNNRNLWIRGSDVNIGRLLVSAGAASVAGVTSLAATIQPQSAGRIANVEIGWIGTERVSSAVFSDRVDFLRINGAHCKNTRTAFYLKDTRHFVLRDGLTAGLGPVNGAPGENSVLMEATAPFETCQGLIENWTAEDTGEHGIRFGGQQTIADVTLRKVTVRRPGSSILGGDLSSGEWHGGCGIKILGGASVGGTRHKRITLDDCAVYDINQTFGTYPTGHGVNNFTPYMVICADDVTLVNCRIDAEDETYSCRSGIIFDACDRLHLVGCRFLKCSERAIRPFEESVFVGYPDYQSPIDNFVVSGGIFEVSNLSGGCVMYMSEATEYVHSGWHIDGPLFIGGSAALAITTPLSGGDFVDCNARYTYIDTNAVSGVATTPIQWGGGASKFLSEIIAPFLPSPAYGAEAADGSIFTDSIDGSVRDRVASNWASRITLSQSGYTPTATATTNIDTVSASYAYYQRVGNLVHVFGQITIDPTATGSVAAKMTLPISSALTAPRQLSGTFNSGDGTISGYVTADASSDQAQFVGMSSTTTSRTCAYMMTYVVV